MTQRLIFLDISILLENIKNCLTMNALRSWTHIGKAHKYFYKHIITYGRSLFHPLYYHRCCCNHVELIAFAFNGRGFANSIPVFFYFCPSCLYFWTNCQIFFRECFTINYQVIVWPRLDSFLGHIKTRFLKK